MKKILGFVAHLASAISILLVARRINILVSISKYLPSPFIYFLVASLLLITFYGIFVISRLDKNYLMESIFILLTIFLLAFYVFSLDLLQSIIIMLSSSIACSFTTHIHQRITIAAYKKEVIFSPERFSSNYIGLFTNPSIINDLDAVLSNNKIINISDLADNWKQPLRILLKKLAIMEKEGRIKIHTFDNKFYVEVIKNGNRNH